MLNKIKSRRGEADSGSFLRETFVYLLLLVIFVAVLGAHLWSARNSATVWEDFYAKELVKILDLSKKGDFITLDVHKATEIAKSNGVKDFREIFSFRSATNEVCVSLSRQSGTCYSYFANVAVKDNGQLALGGERNLLTLEILSGGRA